MEHTFKIEKELKITTENIVDCVLCCEAGGFDYWGELCSDEKGYEAARQRLTEREKADICAMLDINQELLVAAVKSMQRKERHNGRWDNPNYTCWMNEDDKKRLARFLSNERGESGVYPWFSSTGRKKPWCE